MIAGEELGDYVRGIADLMYLRDWDIRVSDDPDDEPEGGVDASRCATFAGTLGRRAGFVWINREWWAQATPEERRQTVVHELIHAHEHGSREVVIHALTIYPKKTGDVLQGIFDVQMEYAIDTLADVIAPFMPLPPVVATTVRTTTTLDGQTTSETATLVEFASDGDKFQQRGDPLTYPRTGVLADADVGDSFVLTETK